MFEKPANGVIVFKCDACPAMIRMSYGSPPDGGSENFFVAAVAGLHSNGWTSQKVIGQPWDNYCQNPACQRIAFERKQDSARREAIRERNGR